MSKCPYDGFECEIHTKRIDDWKRMVRFLKENKVNRTFITGRTMFDNCDSTGVCVRYINLMRKPQKTK